MFSLEATRKWAPARPPVPIMAIFSLLLGALRPESTPLGRMITPAPAVAADFRNWRLGMVLVFVGLFGMACSCSFLGGTFIGGSAQSGRCSPADSSGNVSSEHAVLCLQDQHTGPRDSALCRRAGRLRRTRRRAGVVEGESTPGQPIQVRRDDGLVSQRVDRVGPLVVGEEEQGVRSAFGGHLAPRALATMAPRATPPAAAEAVLRNSRLLIPLAAMATSPCCQPASRRHLPDGFRPTTFVGLFNDGTLRISPARRTADSAYGPGPAA